jgi:putative acetyltransferase
MLIVRNEKPEDFAAIHEVNEKAFGRPAEANLVDALRANGKVTLSLVAVQDGKIVGHILFSPVTIESEKGTFAAVGLAPMAVLPEHQNQAVGSNLVRAGLDACRKSLHEIIVVLGHPAFYPRFGFAPASRHGIKSEYDVRDEVFMIMELREGALAGRSGVVKYQPEFNEV